MLIYYPQSLAKAVVFGQGNLDLVREKSGKCQGILLSIICGNPEYCPQCMECNVSCLSALGLRRLDLKHFSSPEPLAHGELLSCWMSVVRRHPSSTIASEDISS